MMEFFHPLLAITNKAAMNIHVRLFVWTYALGKYLSIEWMEYMVGVCLFKKLTVQRGCTIYIPTGSL